MTHLSDSPEAQTPEAKARLLAEYLQLPQLRDGIRIAIGYLHKNGHSHGAFTALRHMYVADRIVDNVEVFLLEALREARAGEMESVRRVDGS